MSVIHFWIFSYNRGEFLQNCVASIEACAPHSPIQIFDDNSQDGHTRAVLAELATRYPVFQPKVSGEQSKHGGLYANMQAAYEMCESDQLVCFLQDDTQLVRAIAPVEVARMHDFFVAQARSCFVQPAFLLGINKGRDAKATRYDATQRVYFVDRFKRSAGAFYSDICMFRVGGLRAVKWQFVTREAGNERQARAHLAQMAYWRDPFVAWLPNVPAFRGKSRTVALRLAEKFRECGFYPLQYLSSEQLKAFLERPDDAVPYAEEYLHVRAGNVAKPWIYYPLQGIAPLKWLNSIELKLRRICGS